MSVFDDEIYTISDDSESEHGYVPKKSLFATLKDNKRKTFAIGIPILTIIIVIFAIVTRPQPYVSQITVHNKQPSNSSSANNTQSPTNSSSNQHSQTNSSSTSTTGTAPANLVQRFVNQVGSLLHIAQPIASSKPNWEAFPAGTNIKAQNTQTSSNSTSSNTPNSSNSSNTTQSSNSSTPTPTNNDIQLVFKDPNGTVEVYQPPPLPPSEIIWGRYVNTTDRYAIDYPTNWQIVKTYYNGHEGISLYLPGAIIDQYAQFIGFGWATYYLLPEGVNVTTAYTSPIAITGVNGTLYTQGALGYSYIASVFQYQNGYWGLGTSISDPTFAYVYDHMINSLVFNQ